MSLKTIPVILPAILIACSAAALSPAQAGDKQVAFQYQPEELKTAASLQRLYSRIHSHANDSCVQRYARPLYMRRVETACARGLVEDFIAGIGNRRLDRLHAAEQDRRIAAAY